MVMTAVETPIMHTSYLHAGKSHYTLRWCLNSITGARRGVALLEEQWRPNGTCFLTTYSTPIAIKNRLYAAKRYDLHSCGEGGCSHTPTQANNGASEPQSTPIYRESGIERRVRQEQDVFENLVRTIRQRMHRDENCTDTDCPNAHTSHAIGHSCYPAIEWDSERPDSHTSACGANCTRQPDAYVGITVETHTEDVCDVIDCILRKGGDHIRENDCLVF